MTERLLYPIAWFKNVYDTEPKREAVTLQQLTRILTTFELKPQVLRRMTREIERTKSAWKRWESGEAKHGKRTIKFQKAAEKAEEAGEDPLAAARAVFDKKLDDARQNTKREMRLWSPALFREGGRRESDDVICMSALVLDYDDGTSIRDATEVWGRWYHIVHTTWSHTAEVPRFRIIFPLMDLVPADEWDPVYTWAEARAVGVPDHSKKGIATTFALPTMGNRRWPREAFVHQGELFAPVSEGIIAPHPPVTVPDLEPGEITLVGGDPEATYVEHQGVDPHAWGDLDDDDIWSGGAVVTTPGAGVVAEAPTLPRATAREPQKKKAPTRELAAPDVPTNTTGTKPSADGEPSVGEPTPDVEPPSGSVDDRQPSLHRETASAANFQAAFMEALHSEAEAGGSAAQTRGLATRLRALRAAGVLSESEWHGLMKRLESDS